MTLIDSFLFTSQSSTPHPVRYLARTVRYRVLSVVPQAIPGRLGYLTRLILTCLISFCLTSPAATAAFEPTQYNDNDRTQFQLAMQALENGAQDVFHTLQEINKDYILYPYLVYYDLRERINSAADEEILAFLETYKDTPLSSRLRREWLFELGETEQWSKYLSVYTQHRSTRLKCYQLIAQSSLFNDESIKKKILQETEKLWMVGYEQTKSCDPLMDNYEASHLITPKKIWQRIELAMERGHTKLAQRLSKTFNKRDRKSVDLWIKVHEKPEKFLKLRQIKKDTLLNRTIVLHGIKRIARQDAKRAEELWRNLSRRYGYTQDERAEMSRRIALNAAYQNEDSALEMLKSVDSKWTNEGVRIWRARTALRSQQWDELVSAINALKKEEREDYKWQYWLARGNEQLGRQDESRLIYSQLAEQTNYYGFLAADKINQAYRFNSQPIEKDLQQIATLIKQPAIQRAYELYLNDQIADARREWNYATRDLNEDQLVQASVMAHEWEWHDNAILTVAKTSHRRDLSLRFPTPYKDLVFSNAETYNLDPAFIYGVARRESAFKVDARSSTGALGLMQLMPGTARYQSRLLGIDKPTVSELLTSEKNIFLGSAYLSNMLTRFNGNQVLAAAAYNAGPNRIDRYIPKTSTVPADIWVDTLPIRETREYVRAVLAYSTIFNWRLDKEVMPLKNRMSAIGAVPENISSLATPANTIH